MKARAPPRVELYTYRATVASVTPAIRKMINDARNEVELSAHPRRLHVQPSDPRHARPFRAVFRHAGILVVVIVVVRVPGNFAIFSPSFVETTCDDAEHT